MGNCVGTTHMGFRCMATSAGTTPLPTALPRSVRVQLRSASPACPEVTKPELSTARTCQRSLHRKRLSRWL
jgi:hypothetical protein